MDPKNNNLSPEEAKLEQEALAESKAEEIRAKIVEEFGFDPINDQERIDKLVTKEMESRKKLSDAIGQKIKHRNEANELKSKQVTPPVKPANNIDPTDIQKTAKETVRAELEQDALDEMDYPENIKAEIKRVAQISGKSVKAVARDPYIVSTFIEPYEKTKKAEEAAISRKNRSSGSKEFKFDSPPEIDTSSDEAFKKSNAEYEEWRKEMVKAGH
jgi:hypothetical protein